MPQNHARIIAVANQKGGVGKSTTAVSLGAAIAELGRRVLVVDLDPQGNASTGLGIRHEARAVTVYDVLVAEAPIGDALVSTPVENLFAVPSTIDLAGAEIELVSQFSRELRLRKALEPLKASDFDFILLDCPPSLGLLTVNALAAAEELIVPIQCEYYALEGLGQLLRNVTLVQQNVNPTLRLTGIVMTMFDPRTKLSEQVVEEVRRYFGDRVYDTIIPRTVRLSEAPGFGQPITVYDPKSRGAQCYRDLASEVVTKLPSDEGLPVIDEMPSVIIAPPEPEPARAPRPLVREEANVEQAPEPEAPAEPVPDVQPRLAPTGAQTRADEPATRADEPGAEAPQVGSPRGRASETVETEQAPSVLPPDEREDVPSSAARPAPAPEVETTRHDPPTGAPIEGERADEGEVTPDAIERPADRPPRREAEPVPAPRLEVGHVIVIDEDEPAEPERPMPEPEEEEDTPQPRRRWGLFRRGGER